MTTLNLRVVPNKSRGVYKYEFVVWIMTMVVESAINLMLSKEDISVNCFQVNRLALDQV